MVNNDKIDLVTLSVIHNFGGFHPETGQYYANYHFEGGGWGARHYKDGNHAVIVPNGNCRNTPAEVFETRYPWVTLSYELVQDSAGPGEHRGGLGTRRILEVVEPAEINILRADDPTTGMGLRN